MSAHGHVDMGHTVAGWTGTATAVVGFTIIGMAVAAASVPIALAGIGITLGASLLTWLLHLAGWGKPSGPRPESEWSWKVRDHAARTGHPDCLGCRLAGRRAGSPEKASNAVPIASTVTA